MLPILSLLLISCLSPVQLQDSSITFSPTSSICVGDTVSITCYGYPTEGMELEPYAEIILTTNVNLGITLTFTINSSIPGYSVTGDIPVEGSSARLQLTILSYQLTHSDSSIACAVTYADSGNRYIATSSRTPPLSVRPSSPVVTSLIATPQSAVTCTNFILSWVPADSDNTIDRYHIFRGVIGVSSTRREFVATTADDQLIINDPLEIATRYFYHVIASNCVGNSTQSAPGIISLSVYIDNLHLSYDTTDEIITVDWNMDYGTFPRHFRYSLDLTYSLTDGNTTQEVYTFSRISTDDNTFLIKLPNDVITGANISACIQIIEQCGQEVTDWDAMECSSFVIDTTETLPTNSMGLDTVPIPTLVSSVLLALVSIACLVSLVVICLLTKCNVSLRTQIRSKEREIPDRFII